MWRRRPPPPPWSAAARCAAPSGPRFHPSTTTPLRPPPCRCTAGSQQQEVEEAALTRQLTRAGLAGPSAAAPGLEGTTPEFEFAQSMRAFPPAKHDVLGLEELLTPEEREVRQRVRRFAEDRIAPVVADYWERAEFPHALVPEVRGGRVNTARPVCPRVWPRCAPCLVAPAVAAALVCPCSRRRRCCCSC